VADGQLDGAVYTYVKLTSCEFVHVRNFTGIDSMHDNAQFESCALQEQIEIETSLKHRDR